MDTSTPDQIPSRRWLYMVIGIVAVMLLLGVLTLYARAKSTPPQSEVKQVVTSTPTKTASPSAIPTIATRSASVSARPASPDLTITAITYRPAPPPTSSPGMPSETNPGVYEFTITVKNSGAIDFKDSVYVLNTRSQYDLDNEYYSHAALINENKDTIPVGGTKDFVIQDFIDGSVPSMRFAVNLQTKKDNLTVKDESNYNNNEYELEFKP